MLHHCDITVFSSYYHKKSFEISIGREVYNSVCISPIVNLQTIKQKSLTSLDVEDEELWFSPTFLFVGELNSYGGYDLLLEAHAELIKEGLKSYR
ncbi:glycosyltransferase [Chryseobacterium fistulae]|uniref:Uncharacterized protein n=1 Tax=Chryseobacterium fistulae TaxID=2675058 RepID=A0A6N4XT96_9FLAO|nr:glycosyltransferase [Chryseobacterium fistulae]CAA7392655.1 hypothetical protein CHRY9393_03381 [Chryseobacterium fistulae]